MVFDKMFILTVLIFILLSWPAFASLNDPTKPIYSENNDSQIITTPVIKEKKVIVLQSILYGKKNKVAVVNGNFYKEGDNINQIEVKFIHKNYVTVVYKSNRVDLTLAKKVYLDKVTGEINE